MAIMVVPTLSWAVGTCTQAVTDYPSITNPSVKKLVFVCTADASAATYPSTAVTAANMLKLNGWTLISGSSVNGATGPTASSTITLSTTNEGDILGGAGKTPSAATAALANKFKPVVDTAYVVTGPVPITGDLTLAISGNAVNSAVTTIVFKFLK